MTEDQLNEILDGKDLLSKIDIRTLVIDLIKNSPDSDILQIFYSKLPELNEEYIKRFIYMVRE